MVNTGLHGKRLPTHGGNHSKAAPYPLPLRVALAAPIVLLFLGICAAFAWAIFLHQQAYMYHPLSHQEEEKGGTSSSTTSTTTSTSTAFTKLKIPTPVFVTSLPKSGTTSTWKYFLCGLGAGQAAHQWVSLPTKTNNGTYEQQQVRLGKCMQDNIRSGKKRKLFQDCGDYQVWTDAGFIAPGTCFYPSIHGGLEALVESYPQGATILQVVRETQAWVNSTTQFNDLWTRWKDKCEAPFPTTKASSSTSSQQQHNTMLEDYAKFYDWHTNMVRQFAAQHPAMTYIEVTLEGDDTGKILEERTGINASCWVHSKTKKGRRAKPNWKKKKKEQPP